MATTPVNNSKLLSPLIQPKAAEAGKSKGPAKTDVGAADRPGAQPGAAAAGASNVNISTGAKSRAEAHAKALDIARNTPDVREDRVAALKAQIDGGTYQIDSGKIADGMLREAVKDHLANMDDR